MSLVILVTVFVATISVVVWSACRGESPDPKEEKQLAPLDNVIAEWGGHVLQIPFGDCMANKIVCYGVHLPDDALQELWRKLGAKKPGDMLLVPRGVYVEWGPVELNEKINEPYGLASYQ
jgi:hypothetical protein